MNDLKYREQVDRAALAMLRDFANGRLVTLRLVAAREGFRKDVTDTFKAMVADPAYRFAERED